MDSSDCGLFGSACRVPTEAALQSSKEMVPTSRPAYGDDTARQLDVKHPNRSCDLRRVVCSQSTVCRLFAQVDWYNNRLGGLRSAGETRNPSTIALAASITPEDKNSPVCSVCFSVSHK